MSKMNSLATPKVGMSGTTRSISWMDGWVLCVVVKIRVYGVVVVTVFIVFIVVVVLFQSLMHSFKVISNNQKIKLFEVRNTKVDWGAMGELMGQLTKVDTEKERSAR